MGICVDVLIVDNSTGDCVGVGDVNIGGITVGFPSAPSMVTAGTVI